MFQKLSLYFVVSLFSTFLFFSPLSAQFGEFTHPELNWQTFETEHFIFHYHQGTKRTAFVSAKIAEEIYPAVTGLYN